MILFIDTETTGLPGPLGNPLELQPRIIEIYAALTNNKGKIKKEFETLIDPGIPIPDFITKITHIDQTMVYGQPRFKDIAKDFARFCKKANTMVAHNLPFDHRMFEIEYERIGRPLPLPKDLFCTVEQSMHIKGFRLKLMEIHQLATGLPEIPGAHRARNDVKAMIKAWKWLKEQTHGLDK